MRTKIEVIKLREFISMLIRERLVIGKDYTNGLTRTWDAIEEPPLVIQRETSHLLIDVFKLRPIGSFVVWETQDEDGRQFQIVKGRRKARMLFDSLTTPGWGFNLAKEEFIKLNPDEEPADDVCRVNAILDTLEVIREKKRINPAFRTLIHRFADRIYNYKVIHEIIECGVEEMNAIVSRLSKANR